MWVACLAFLAKQKVREQTNQQEINGSSYFHTLKNTMMLQNTATSQPPEETKDKKKKKSRSKSSTGSANQHKFSNITAKAFISVLNEDPTMKNGMKDSTQHALSEKALQTKGLWNYLKTIKQ